MYGNVARREAILEAIDNYIRLNRVPPSLREIATAVGISSTGHMFYVLARLVDEGYLYRVNVGQARAYLPVRHRDNACPHCNGTGYLAG